MKNLKRRFLFTALTMLCGWFNPVYSQEDYRTLHQQALVVDTHCDVLMQILRGQNFCKRSDWGHVDLVRLQAGQVDVQFFAVWPNPELYKPDKMYDQTLNLIALFNSTMSRCQGRIGLARTPQEIMQLTGQGKIAACLAVEGGTAIENNLDKLEKIYELGARYLSLTWNDSPDWASSAQDEASETYQGVRGLSGFGRQVVQTMNRLGMLIDLSHSGEQTFRDVMKITTQPVIASHSCVYALAPHVRNLKDEQIIAISKNGGYIGINFYAGFLDLEFDKKYSSLRKAAAAHLDSVKAEFGQNYTGYCKYQEKYYLNLCRDIRPDINLVVDHIEYIINLVGDDNVGIGSDFDGMSVTPRGLEDASKMPELTRIMLERGFSRERINKILGGNFMRVFRAVQP